MVIFCSFLMGKSSFLSLFYPFLTPFGTLNRLPKFLKLRKSEGLHSITKGDLKAIVITRNEAIACRKLTSQVRDCFVPRNDKKKLKNAQRPDGKPGRELASRAEGFFRLDFLLLFYQGKSSSPPRQ
jgi:hypothetical protein